MTSLLLTNPRKLRLRLNELQKTLVDGSVRSHNFTGELVEAIAEGSFRLALDPSTPPAEAFELLTRSVRLDGTNPKYAYHLARLYFLYGLFDHARTWLQTAGQLAPTSHRIWTYISLLQKELNATYRGDDNYEPDALLQRSDAIIKQVSDGKDTIDLALSDFVPPVSLAKIERDKRNRDQSDQRLSPTDDVDLSEDQRDDNHKKPGSAPQSSIPVKRLTNPEQCRWSGVSDQSAEWLLEALPTQSNLTKLIPLLEKVANLAEKRTGGKSAFVILAIQWILSGYPIEPVEELRKRVFAGQGGPALQLLDRVVMLYQVEEAGLASALAQALEKKELPPALVAIIHQRRLLWAPLEFRAMGVYREAKKFLTETRQANLASSQKPAEASEEQTKNANEIIHRIDNAINTLHPERPAAFKYKPAAASAAPMDVASLEQNLNQLSEATHVLADLRNQAFDHLKNSVEPVAKEPADEGAFAQAWVDRNFYDGLKTALKEAGNTGLQRLSDILKAASDMDSTLIPVDFEQLKEGCQKAFAELSNLGNIERILLRTDSRLKLAAERFHMVEKEPSPKLVAILANIQKVFAVQTQLADPTAAADAGTADTPQSLAAQANENRAALDTIWVQVKQLIDIHKSTGLDAAQLATVAEIAQLVEQKLAACEQGLQTTQSLRENGQVSLDSIADLDHAEQQFRENLTRRGPFSRNFQKLPKPQPSASPSFVSDTTNPAKNTNPDSASQISARDIKPKVGVELVEQKLKELDSQIELLYQHANDSLVPYSETARHLPPILALWMTVNAHQAETCYRIGHYRQARQIWNSMAAEDRLDANIMKNIALCDRHAADMRASLNAWQSYVELLYVYDIVGGSPRSNARRRADFHRTFAAAYGPASLPGEISNAWFDQIDRAAFITFFASPARVRSFVNHTLLEFFNQRFDFTSPLLILGLSRSEGIRVTGGAANDEKARQNAAMASEPVKKLGVFLDTAAEIFPKRVRRGFNALCKQHIEKAAIQSATPERVSTRNDPEYTVELPRAVEWVQGILSIKFKISLLLRDQTFLNDLVQHMNSVDFLSELVRLDRIPIDTSDKNLRAAAAHIHVAYDPGFSELMKTFSAAVINTFLEFIFNEENRDKEVLRKQQYNRLINDWVRNPVFETSIEMIDDPRFFYLPQIKPFLDLLNGPPGAEQKRALVKTIAALEDYSGRYPELSGPVTLLVNLLLQNQDFIRAIEILDRTCERGFNPGARPGLYYMRMIANFNQAQHEFEAKRFDAGLKLVQPIERDANLVLRDSDDEEQKKNAKEFCTFGCANMYATANKYQDAYDILEKVPVAGLSAGEKSMLYYHKADYLYNMALADFKAERKKDTVKKLEKSRGDAKRAVELAEDQEGEVVKQAQHLIASITETLGKLSGSV